MTAALLIAALVALVLVVLDVVVFARLAALNARSERREIAGTARRHARSRVAVPAVGSRPELREESRVNAYWCRCPLAVQYADRGTRCWYCGGGRRGSAPASRSEISPRVWEEMPVVQTGILVPRSAPSGMAGRASRATTERASARNVPDGASAVTRVAADTEPRTASRTAPRGGSTRPVGRGAPEGARPVQSHPPQLPQLEDRCQPLRR